MMSILFFETSSWKSCDFCFEPLSSLQSIRKCLRAINESRAQKRKVMNLFFLKPFLCSWNFLYFCFLFLFAQIKCIKKYLCLCSFCISQMGYLFIVCFHLVRFYINGSSSQKFDIYLFLPCQAGQVYGVPLADSLLTKPGVFPEQRPCTEDFRKKWIEVSLYFGQAATSSLFYPLSWRGRNFLNRQ